MPHLDKNKTNKETATLVIAIITLIVTFFAFAMNENIFNLFGKVNIIANKESINLKPIIKKDTIISVIKIQNTGSLASDKTKIIVEFNSKIPQYGITSDETIIDTVKSPKKLIISVDRLSHNSSIRITLFSEAHIIQKMHYVNNDGIKEILMQKQLESFNFINLFFLLLIIISILAIIWANRKDSEKSIIQELEKYHGETEERLREIKDKMGNIDITVDESKQEDNNESSPEIVMNRLAEVFSKLPRN